MTGQGRSILDAYATLLNNATREETAMVFQLVVCQMHGKGIKPEKPEMDLLERIR